VAASRQTRALWHPLRARILELIIRGPVTLSQIATAIDEPIAKVAYHSRVLCGAGCIQAVEAESADAADPLYEASA
jgi:predicted transcriptional regulator